MGERLRDFDELIWIAPLDLARDLEVQQGSLTAQQAGFGRLSISSSLARMM